MYNEKNIKIYNNAPCAFKASELFRNEIKLRAGFLPECTDCAEKADLLFILDEKIDRDAFAADENNGKITFRASGIRGFVFAVGLFLRKIRKCGDGFELVENISGEYKPDMSIRGHQLGYRTTPNTYDAWTYEDYYRYYIDLMFFGCNTVEHIPYQHGVSERNALMKYDEEEFLVKACEMADDLDLNVSLWHPNYDNETDESAAKLRSALYKRLKRLDYLFIPGGDPGDLPADIFVNRVIAISRELKKIHPHAQMWPSAQAPHSIPGWGDTFIAEMEKLPEEIDGVIYGPNHAFPLDVLREKLPEKYPLRFYPDITHNVRCEYPVHYDRDDWNYILTSGLSRECTNPRPLEYSKLHHETYEKFLGSVSYSEGVTDDVNKCIWSALDWNVNAKPDETLRDYSRLFFYGADEDRIAAAILGLEQNWEGNPEVNGSIEKIYEEFVSLYNEYPSLQKNWRFIQLYLRAICDKLLRDRRLEDVKSIGEARALLTQGETECAKQVLSRDYDDGYKTLRSKVDEFCELLFGLIGYQSSVEKYCADGWERGAILDTMDQPVSDRPWLLGKFEITDDPEELLTYFDRDKAGEGELHWSVALDGVNAKQTGEVYMNFQGDKIRVNDGSLPTALFNIFDNLSFVFNAEGLTDGRDYEMIVTYLDDTDEKVTEHKITANGKVIYCGKQFGEKAEEYEKKFCKKGFVCAKYNVPSECIKDGKTQLVFSEPTMGVMLAEIVLRVKK